MPGEFLVFTQFGGEERRSEARGNTGMKGCTEDSTRRGTIRFLSRTRVNFIYSPEDLIFFLHPFRAFFPSLSLLFEFSRFFFLRAPRYFAFIALLLFNRLGKLALFLAGVKLAPRGSFILKIFIKVISLLIVVWRIFSAIF